MGGTFRIGNRISHLRGFDLRLVRGAKTHGLPPQIGHAPRIQNLQTVKTDHRKNHTPTK